MRVCSTIYTCTIQIHMHVCLCVCVFSGEVVSEYLATLWLEPLSSSVHGISQGQACWRGGHLLLQGPSRLRTELTFLRWQADSLLLSCQGSIYIYVLLYLGLAVVKWRLNEHRRRDISWNVFALHRGCGAGHTAALGYLSEEPPVPASHGSHTSPIATNRPQGPPSPQSHHHSPPPVFWWCPSCLTRWWGEVRWSRSVVSNSATPWL